MPMLQTPQRSVKLEVSVKLRLAFSFFTRPSTAEAICTGVDYRERNIKQQGLAGALDFGLDSLHAQICSVRESCMLGYQIHIASLSKRRPNRCHDHAGHSCVQYNGTHAKRHAPEPDQTCGKSGSETDKRVQSISSGAPSVAWTARAS
jgi:hypothetical protein